MSGVDLASMLISMYRTLEDVHYRTLEDDSIGHWPGYGEKKNKCRHCKTGTLRVYCEKCDLCLRLSNIQNCCYEFHQKQVK